MAPKDTGTDQIEDAAQASADIDAPVKAAQQVADDAEAPAEEPEISFTDPYEKDTQKQALADKPEVKDAKAEDQTQEESDNSPSFQTGAQQATDTTSKIEQTTELLKIAVKNALKPKSLSQGIDDGLFVASAEQLHQHATPETLNNIHAMYSSPELAQKDEYKSLYKFVSGMIINLIQFNNKNPEAKEGQAKLQVKRLTDYFQNEKTKPVISNLKKGLNQSAAHDLKQKPDDIKRNTSEEWDKIYSELGWFTKLRLSRLDDQKITKAGVTKKAAFIHKSMGVKAYKAYVESQNTFQPTKRSDFKNEDKGIVRQKMSPEEFADIEWLNPKAPKVQPTEPQEPVFKVKKEPEVKEPEDSVSKNKTSPLEAILKSSTASFIEPDKTSQKSDMDLIKAKMTLSDQTGEHAKSKTAEAVIKMKEAAKSLDKPEQPQSGKVEFKTSRTGEPTVHDLSDVKVNLNLSMPSDKTDYESLAEYASHQNSENIAEKQADYEFVSRRGKEETSNGDAQKASPEFVADTVPQENLPNSVEVKPSQAAPAQEKIEFKSGKSEHIAFRDRPDVAAKRAEIIARRKKTPKLR